MHRSTSRLKTWVAIWMAVLVGTAIAQWTNPPTPDPTPGPPQSTLTSLKTNIAGRVPRPTNAWITGHILTTSDGGMTTYAVASDASSFVLALTNVVGDGSRVTTSKTGQQAYVQFNDSGLATGTPLYVESNPSLVALSNDMANAITTGSLALAWAQAGSNLAAQANSLAGAALPALGGAYAPAVYGISGQHAVFDPELPNPQLGSPLYLSGGTSLGAANAPVVITGGNFVVATAITSRDGETLVIRGNDYGSDVSEQVGLGNGNVLIRPGISYLGVGTLVISNITRLHGNAGAGLTNIFAENIVNAPAAWTNQPSLLVLSNGLASASALGTNAQVAASNATATALAIGAGATSLTMSAWATASNALAAANGVGLVATNLHLAQGIAVTNAQTTASNALAAANGVGLVATNLHLAQGIAVTNAQTTASNAAASVVVVGLVATNAQTTASNAQAAVTGLGVVVSNLPAVSNWSQFAARQVVDLATNLVVDGLGVELVPGASIGKTNLNTLYSITGSGPVWRDGTGTNRVIARDDNIAIIGIQTIATATSLYLRSTSAEPSSSAFAGAAHQVSITARDNTSVWLTVYWGQSSSYPSASNKWYRTILSEF